MFRLHFIHMISLLFEIQFPSLTILQNSVNPAALVHMLNYLKIVNLQAPVGPSLSLSVAPGELVCLTGPSGSGKSLLLRAIADLDAHQGDVWFNNRAAADTPPPLWRKKIGLLQPTSSWWNDGVADHFEKPEAALPIMEALDLPKEALEWQIYRMSTGEKQRMSIVRLLSNTPSALLLDEPTANLDPETTKKVESLVLNYQQEQKSPVIWVSHDLNQVKRIADRHMGIEGDQIQELPL
jgi:sulfonate transport system ATP-binding protein